MLLGLRYICIQKGNKDNMKKKVVALLLVAAMAAALSACGKDETKQPSAGTEASAEAESGTVQFQASQIEYNVADYVTLADYNNIQVEVDDNYTVSDDDVRTYAESMIASYPAYKDSDKSTVEDGDTVKIDFVGKIDDEEFDGGSGEDYPLTIGSGSFIDGFESGLVGSTVGETVSLDLTFPETYQTNPDLAGKPVTFDVTVNKIVEKQDMTYEDMSDDYVKENFQIDTVDDFLTQIREYLESMAESSKQQAVQTAVVEKLTEESEVTIPEGLLDARVADYKTMFESYCQTNYGMSAEEYVEQYQNETIEEYYAEIVTDMETSITQELILEAIAVKEGLEIDESGYESFVQSYMSYYGYTDEADFYDSNGGEDYVRKSYLENMALTNVCENAQVSYAESGSEDGASEDDASGAEDDTSATEE